MWVSQRVLGTITDNNHRSQNHNACNIAMMLFEPIVGIEHMKKQQQFREKWQEYHGNLHNILWIRNSLDMRWLRAKHWDSANMLQWWRQRQHVTRIFYGSHSKTCYNVGPPGYVCWFINPIHYSYLRIINHSDIGVMFTNLGGPTLYDIWANDPKMGWWSTMINLGWLGYHKKSGWWLTYPSENDGVKVSWDDEIPKKGENMFQTTNQLSIVRQSHWTYQSLFDTGYCAFAEIPLLFARGSNRIYTSPTQERLDFPSNQAWFPLIAPRSCASHVIGQNPLSFLWTVPTYLWENGLHMDYKPRIRFVGPAHSQHPQHPPHPVTGPPRGTKGVLCGEVTETPFGTKHLSSVDDPRQNGSKLNISISLSLAIYVLKKITYYVCTYVLIYTVLYVHHTYICITYIYVYIHIYIYIYIYNIHKLYNIYGYTYTKTLYSYVVSDMWHHRYSRKVC